MRMVFAMFSLMCALFFDALLTHFQVQDAHDLGIIFTILVSIINGFLVFDYFNKKEKK